MRKRLGWYKGKFARVLQGLIAVLVAASNTGFQYQVKVRNLTPCQVRGVSLKARLVIPPVVTAVTTATLPAIGAGWIRCFLLHD